MVHRPTSLYGITLPTTLTSICLESSGRLRQHFGKPRCFAMRASSATGLESKTLKENKNEKHLCTYIYIYVYPIQTKRTHFTDTYPYKFLHFLCKSVAHSSWRNHPTWQHNVTIQAAPLWLKRLSWRWLAPWSHSFLRRGAGSTQLSMGTCRAKMPRIRRSFVEDAVVFSNLFTLAVLDVCCGKDKWPGGSLQGVSA